MPYGRGNARMYPAQATKPALTTSGAIDRAPLLNVVQKILLTVVLWVVILQSIYNDMIFSRKLYIRHKKPRFEFGQLKENVKCHE